MNSNRHFHERVALIASIAVTILGWSYMVMAVGSKLLAPTII